MNRTLIAAAFVAAASSVSAGNMSDPVVEPEVVISETVKSAGNDEWVLGMMTFVIFVMVALQ